MSVAKSKYSTLGMVIRSWPISSSLITVVKDYVLARHSLISVLFFVSRSESFLNTVSVSSVMCLVENLRRISSILSHPLWVKAAGSFSSRLTDAFCHVYKLSTDYTNLLKLL